ncbi:YhcN/YlaJ family sporulation lipoprotein [Bacillus sp. FJAT-29790]|uniref:YhcN/YlaJ family sporulation lipoprotein n=1 Tax=Bacillus sp. FJAT-29790 TaxID=1895002 RepID=UPI001C2162CB|nr:YhcN/YlaJ family sporulation lipoprotein [Bacillus sp. FJAT-29790]MBU8878342.1 YhcN/YlaJ family sporulation lipoprotein [Bacillus sp. FJAT-29790]
MKRQALIAVALTAVILSACGVNRHGVNDTALRNQDGVTGPTRVSNPITGDNFRDNYRVNDRDNFRDNYRVNDRVNYRDNYRDNYNYNTGYNNNYTGNMTGNMTGPVGTGFNPLNATPNMYVADRVAQAVLALPEIDQANAIVSNRNAFVAAKFIPGTNELTSTLESKIINQVKMADPAVMNVYVSVSPDFYGRMSGYVNRIRMGHPISGFYNEFHTTARSVFPNYRW